MAKKTGSLINSLNTTKNSSTTSLKEVVKKKPMKEVSKGEETLEAPTPKPKKSKRVSKSYFLSEQNTVDLERYCSILHLKEGEKVNPSAIIDNLITEFLKDKNLTI